MIIEKDQVFNTKADIAKLFGKKFNAQSTYIFVDSDKKVAFWSITRDSSTSWSNKIIDDYVIERSNKKRKSATILKPDLIRLLFIKTDGKYIFNGVYKPIFVDEDNNTRFYKEIATKFDCKKLKTI